MAANAARIAVSGAATDDQRVGSTVGAWFYAQVSDLVCGLRGLQRALLKDIVRHSA
jgi:hypothetical protein